MLVARNVSEDVYDCLDIGKKRSISDILGGDKRVVDTCTYLARLSTGQQTVTPQLVQPFVTAFSEMTEELLRSSQVRSKGLGATAIRAPVVIHMFRSDKHYNHCLTQYPAMLSRNYSFMAKSVQALVRQVDGSTRTNIGHIWEQSARAWIAFDVFRSDLERIQVKNHMYSVEEMRAVISSRMREKQKEFIAA